MKAYQALEILGKTPDNFKTADFELRGLSLDSRTVSKDYCFIAIKGNNSDGSNFIQTAIDKGARMIVYEQVDQNQVSGLTDPAIVFVPVANARISAGKLGAEYFHNPGDELTSIGITGTNGKTTISYLIEHILKMNGINSGIIGTIQYKISDHIVPALNTTPDAVKLQHLMRHMVEHKLTHNIMEVSSHALDQFRVQGVEFKTAIFTNLTHDHLDYHKSKEQYFSAKAKLFSGLSAAANAVINADDPYAEKLKLLTKAKIISYAVDKAADVKAENIVLGMDQTSFVLVYKKTGYNIRTNLIGRYNVYNVLAAVCAVMAEGLTIEKIAAALRSMPQVRGRLERIKNNQGFEVFIDYAHTEDALNNVLSTLRELKPHKIITVFGCGGDRDKHKRSLMGRSAARFSDYLIITNDNPRGEDPLDIIAQIKTGFTADFKAYEIIPDRDKAIQRACGLAGKNDFVLIAGKGHETTQIFKDKTIQFDDKKVVLDFFNQDDRG